MFSAGNDLLALINDVLDLSKIEAGHLEMRPTNTAIGRTVQSLERTFRPMANEKKLEWSQHVAAGVPETIETDGRKLEQILKNLLSNAFKFTKSGGVRLDVSSTEEGEVCFAVRDTGIGIPPAQHELIFEEFRQLDAGATRKYGGTGLGLTISRRLARLLGGDVTVESTEDQGSTFRLTIPSRPRPRPWPAADRFPAGPLRRTHRRRRDEGGGPAVSLRTPRSLRPTRLRAACSSSKTTRCSQSSFATSPTNGSFIRGRP